MAVSPYVSVDFETFLIDTDYPEPYGHQGASPLPVCISIGMRKAKGDLQTRVLVAEDMKTAMSKLISSDKVLVGQNIAFDMLVAWRHLGIPLRQILDKYEKGEILCTQIRELLLDIKSGDITRVPNKKRSLAALTLQYLKEDVSASKGEDAWRMRYSELYGIPLDEWPQDAIDYPLQDADTTLRVFEKQSLGSVSEDEAMQCRAAFDLALISSFSPKVHPGNTTRFLDVHARIMAKMFPRLEKAGIAWWNPKHHKDEEGQHVGGYSVYTNMLREYVQLDYNSRGLTAPTTPKGQVSTAGATLLGCDTRLLRDYGEVSKNKKIMEGFAPILNAKKGKQVFPWYNTLVSTGRTSCSYPNLQQMPKMPGARECFERVVEGNVLVGQDYDSFEMFGLAQTVYEEFGIKPMLDVLNNKRDPHLYMMAHITGRDYKELIQAFHAKDEEVNALRQIGKVYNFGAAGGMAAETFISTMSPSVRAAIQAMEPDTDLVTLVQRYIHAWIDVWELRPMFDKVKRMTRGGRKFAYTQPITGRVRAGLGYTQGLNSHFQPRCADAAKRGFARVIYETVDLGVRPAIFVHDELVSEIPEKHLEEYSEITRKCLIEGAREILPDCNLGVGTEVCGLYWRKKGCTVSQYLEHGEAFFEET